MTLETNSGAGKDKGPILAIDRVSLAFGGVLAINDVSFEVQRSHIHAIIGPNGAGKSSMLNIINGFYKPSGGAIFYKGRRHASMDTHRAARSGISRTFQNIALFHGMTTLDNLLSGRILKIKGSLLAQALFWGPYQRQEVQHRERVEDIIDFLEIQAIRKSIVGMLPYGLQKRVELGRALAAEPDLLLLDEPMAGMNLEEKQDMCRFIIEINRRYDTTIVLIEHDMGVVMELSDYVVVLNYGNLLAQGKPAEIQQDQDVIDAYLGVRR